MKPLNYLVTLVSVIILAACRPTILQTTTPMLAPTQVTPTVTQNLIVDPLVISSENIHKLDVIDRWGMGRVYGAALSPNGQIIAFGTNSGVFLYDSSSLEQTGFINLQIRSNRRLSFPNRPLSFSPDNNLLAIVNGNILLANVNKKDLERTLIKHIADCDIDEIGINPQGNTIAVICTGTRNAQINCDSTLGNFALYDLSSGNPIYEEYFCPDYTKFFFENLNDEQVVFSGSSPKIGLHASYINSNTGELIKKVSVDDPIYNISPDGSLISTITLLNGPSNIVDAETKKVINQQEGQVLFIPGNSKSKILIKEDSWVLLNNNQEEICTFEDPPQVYLDTYRPIFDFSGNYFLFWNNPVAGLTVWDLATCQIKWRIQEP